MACNKAELVNAACAASIPLLTGRKQHSVCCNCCYYYYKLRTFPHGLQQGRAGQCCLCCLHTTTHWKKTTLSLLQLLLLLLQTEDLPSWLATRQSWSMLPVLPP